MKSKISADNLKFPLKYSVVLCGYYLLSTFVSPNIATALDAESILKRAEPSIVTIENLGTRRGQIARETSTGCIVSSDGFILTDSGVTIRPMQAGNDAPREMQIGQPKNGEQSGSTSFQVQFSNGASASAGLVATDERLNIALLKVNASWSAKYSHSAAQLGNSNAVRKNEQIAIIGASFKGVGITFLYATVTHNKRLREPGVGIFQITSTFHPVHRGSPVLNSEGAVIGIIIGKIYKKDNVGFAIPINSVKRFLEQHGVKWQEPGDLIATNNLLDNNNLFIAVLLGIPAVGIIIVVVVALGGRGKGKKQNATSPRGSEHKYSPVGLERKGFSAQGSVAGANIAKLHNLKTGEYHPLSSADVTIGRSSKNAVVISDETVSRQHAVINKSGGEYIIQNVSTTNHTYVNGNQIEQYELQHGDKICMGNATLVFLFSQE